MLAERMTRMDDHMELRFSLRFVSEVAAKGEPVEKSEVAAKGEPVEKSEVADKGEPAEKRIAVLTSGGDAQGMNAALRGIVRAAIYAGCTVYFVREGYKGLVEGGPNISPITWSFVSDILHTGGTVIGSTRSEAFRTREGRLQACRNLVRAGVAYLVVIGGDGSLSGALCLRQEWSSHLAELVSEGSITAREAGACSNLRLVGLVASIDNDFHGTDMTIGCDSALHRIVEAMDSIISTASSHQRCFIMEIMGRNCGYLSIKSAMACEADYVFVPEVPEPDSWPETLCNKLSYERRMGKRMNIVVVCEGAQDSRGGHISSDMVKEVVVSRLKFDTRVTVLGHVQRGGRPSAFDRILATRMGVEAVRCLLGQAETDQEPKVIALRQNMMVRCSLADSVANTQLINEALKRQDHNKVLELRGRSFIVNLETYKMLNVVLPPESNSHKGPRYTVGVLHVGQPACGMNAVVWTLVRQGAHLGIKVLGFRNGVMGLASGNFVELNWQSVDGWVSRGGASLFTNVLTADGLEEGIALTIQKHSVQALIIIGGFQSYMLALQLFYGRQEHREFCIPITVIPCTISNRVPGTDFTIGADTALNEITAMCDRLRLSAHGTFKRVYISEVMGRHCGYLATMAGIASGADQSYIFEEPMTINDLQQDVNDMKIKMVQGEIVRGLVIRNEEFNPHYTTQFIYQLYAEEGKEVFTTRMLVLGPLQEGVSPTPFDRDLAIKMAASALKWTIQQLEKHAPPNSRMMAETAETVTLTGIVGKEYKFTPVTELEADTDFQYEIPKRQWWMKFRQLAKIVATYKEAYKHEDTSLESLQT